MVKSLQDAMKCKILMFMLEVIILQIIAQLTPEKSPPF